MTTNAGGATVTGSWSLDKRLRVTSYTNLSTAAGGNNTYSYSLTYTSNGNVASSAETAYSPGSGVESWSWTNSYDTLNRLTQANSAGAIQYACKETYDAWGNRTSEAPVGTPGYSCSSISTPVNTTNHLSGYSYDAAGNLLFDGTNTLTYDSEGRLATATESGSPTTTYTYGADGQRVGKTVNGVTTNYVRDLDGTILTSYVYGTYTNVPQEMWVAGMHFGTVIATSGTTQTQTFSLTNWLGSEAVRTNPSTGIASSAYLSEPFGDGLLTLFGSNTNDIHFTGKERDTESGLDYFGARYVSSNMGRFLSPDWSSNPISIPFVRLDNPQTLNRYSYVNNNPLSRFDPYGHLDCPGGATQDVACLVQAGWNALKNLFSGGSGNSSSSSSSSGNTVAPSPDYQPQFRVTTRILPTFRPPDYYNFNAQLGFANPSFQYVPSTKNFFVNGAFAARKGIGVMATAGWSLSQRPEAYLGGRGVSGCGAYGVAACVGYSPGGGGWAFEVGVGTPTIGGSAGYAVDWNSNCDAYLQDVYQSLPVENPNGAVGIGSGLSITLARMISIANEARSSMNP